ncbi:hypothetical protein GGI25_001535 [Coemansia spiralis]|uniref:Importin N-terminal domain-containing protein n=2 Tax=Coemansia TaxID=4863 RepID=A0A9W8G5W2_9FUNG|nr:hypothetical protein EDC05_002038 [Coemansia umbellata]KAJ2622988.1 hypothetical protein GGI26_002789 [Coemansia sp. RSA 1358]KAJ2679400.1 hypothetical protein GGI25_001535 [Coemansia spiralis]
MALESIDLQAFAQALSVPTQEALEALPQFQRQPAAWQFAFDLLASSNVNCRFYGAHTLQVKVAKDWDTLDEERQHALRDELVRLVVEQSDAPLNVLSKINQTLASYALHAVPDICNNFLPTVINEIEERVRSSGKHARYAGYAVVDFLELLPEELNRASIGVTQHAKLIQDIKESLPDVLDILTSVVRGLPGSRTPSSAPEFAALVGQDPTWRARAWKAILQWLQFGISKDSLFVLLLDMSLQQLETMAEHQLHDSNQVDEDELNAAAAAVDDMTSNIHMAAKHTKTIGTLMLEKFGQPWFSTILELSIANGEDQRALQWGSMLVSFGETYTEFLIRKLTDPQLSEHVSTFLKIMLALSGFPGYHGITEDLSDQPLNFWYLLQETLVDFLYDAEDNPELSQTVASTQAAIKQVYIELLKVLVSKCAYPPTNIWMDADRDEREKFISYRREAADALLNTYYVLREDMLPLLIDEVISSMGSFALDRWQSLESLLFALKSIGEAVPETESTFLPRLFSADLLRQNFMPMLQASLGSDDRAAQWGLTSIKTSILSLIGAYGEWWKGHPELLPVAVPCVTSSLSQPPLVQAAVAAFRRICDSCRDQLTGATGSMVILACEVLLAGNTVPAREQQRIFESVAEVSMAQSPVNQIQSITPLILALSTALSKSASLLEDAPKVSSTSDLEPYLAPLLNHLRLVESLARGFQFSDEIEETALVGEPESKAALTFAAQCYRNSRELRDFRTTLLALMNREVSLEIWPRDLHTNMVQIDDSLLECILSIINNSAKRGPHVFAFEFGDIVAFIGNAWNTAIARVENATGVVIFGRRWSDQCPAFLQCISQLVVVFSTKANDWQLTRPDIAEADRLLGVVLTRVIDDVYAGISREADALTTAIEQQPVIAEYIFDLCTRVLQTRYELFVDLEPSSIGRLCDLGVQALSIPNRLALKPTAYFLTTLIRLSSSDGSSSGSGGSGSGDGAMRNSIAKRVAASKLLESLWHEYGAAWLRTTLAAIGGMHPRSLLPNLSELLFAMIRHHLTTIRQWMTELLSQPEFPSPFVDGSTKRQFLQQILATRSFTKAKGIINEFSIKCRNLQDTAYIG